MLLVPPPGHRRLLNTKLIDELRNLSLTSGLVLCLDAGDSASYDGTSQTWNDVSGNGNNFYRGSGSGSDSLDPTFHGTADARSPSEYFQTDGGDAFWQTSSQTFMSAWHKAGATFTMGGWVYLPSPPVSKALGLCRNFRDNTDLGMGVGINAGPFVAMVNASGSGSGQIFGPALDVVSAQWQFACVSFAEGTGASFAHVNGEATLFPSDSYSSPSSTTAPNGVSIMGLPDAAGTSLNTTEGVQNESGQRVNSVMAFNRALSQAEALRIYNATKGKFGY